MRSLAFKRFIRVALCVGVLAGLAAADSLQLKDGRTIHGKYLGGTSEQIEFLVNGLVKRYAVSDVLVVAFGDDSSSSRQMLPSAPAAAATSPAASPKAVSSAPTTVTVPAGTQIVVRMIDSIDSNRNAVGDPFHASLEDDLVAEGTLVAPRGAEVRGRLVEAKEAGHISGRSELKLELTGITINGQNHAITTSDYDVAGKSRGSSTAKRVGGGAALGAIIGAIAGGGKGAAIGAGVGAGAGTAVQVATRGEQVHVPSETVLSFTLRQDATLPVAAASMR